MSKVIREYRKTIINNDGEILSESKEEVIRHPVEPPYVKLYIDDILYLSGLKGHLSGLVYELVKRMDYKGIVTLTTRWKQETATILNIKVQTLNNYIQDIKKKMIMKPIGRSEFMMNPHIFAKGSWTDIRKMRNEYLKLTIIYKNGKRIISSSFENTLNSDLKFNVSDWDELQQLMNKEEKEC